MQAILQSIWFLLGVPTLLGLILTVIVFVAAFLVKQYIVRAMNRDLENLKHDLENLKHDLQQTIEDRKFVQSQDLEKLKSELQQTIEDRKFVQSQDLAKLQSELQQTIEKQNSVYNLYEGAGIVTYTREQFAALMKAYRDLYEGEGATATGKTFAEIVRAADKNIMKPFNEYYDLLDRQTIDKIYRFHYMLSHIGGNPSPDTIERFRNWKAQFLKDITYDAYQILQPEKILERKGIYDNTVRKQRGD